MRELARQDIERARDFAGTTTCSRDEGWRGCLDQLEQLTFPAET